MTPNLANDGIMDTRWSGIPGHNTGGWYELAWAEPVRVGQVIVFQYDRYVKEMDVQVWDEQARAWVTLQHFGQPNDRLPKVIVGQFPIRRTSKLRLANITNGPSFTEVQAFEEPNLPPPIVNLASDVNGHFIGMVCDAWGNEPITGAEMRLSGQAKNGAWQEAAKSDHHGLVFLNMPLGMNSPLTLQLRMPASTSSSVLTQPLDAAHFFYGLTPDHLQRHSIQLAGPWRFAVDPRPISGNRLSRTRPGPRLKCRPISKWKVFDPSPA